MYSRLECPKTLFFPSSVAHSHFDFDASGTSNAMFDELAEMSVMSPLTERKHTHVSLAIFRYNNENCLPSSFAARSKSEDSLNLPS